ncbi:MAG: prepilin-type N-terminal cleavage/methylation domain-containing protein [Candidatus Omnitrophica bacterium]|nr:prepilin-type N-terminal cleavage/methylation domain-containing protein [Candidatus Omnitrophota bacterium]
MTTMMIEKAEKRNRGITLIEVILALALGALILASLTGILNISLKSWELSEESNELIQIGRVAMERIMSDIRYAVSLSTFSGGVLEFDTKYLDEDDDVETIKYEKSGSDINRSVKENSNYGQANPIANYVDSFGITLLRANGTSTPQANQAASVKIDLTLVSGDETFEITSTAHMRNYNP